MTIATFSASRLYAQRVLRPETAAIFQLSSLPRRPDHCRRVVRRSPAEVIVELLLPFLTLLGTNGDVVRYVGWLVSALWSVELVIEPTLNFGIPALGKTILRVHRYFTLCWLISYIVFPRQVV